MTIDQKLDQIIVLLHDLEQRLPRKKQVSDDQWYRDLRTNPDYVEILDSEERKMDLWLAAHPGRKKTRRFVLNWLSKVERPLPAAKPVLPKAMQKVESRAPGVPPPPEIAEKLSKLLGKNFMAMK